jgi:hypothetical protein
VLSYAGGLIILSLFICNWDIEKCRQIFDTIVKRFFSLNQTMSKSFTKRVRRIIKGCINDGIYSSEDLDQCLKENYGLQDIFSAARSGVSRQKVAVVGTPMHSGHAQLFTNYNATGIGLGEY